VTRRAASRMAAFGASLFASAVLLVAGCDDGGPIYGVGGGSGEGEDAVLEILSGDGQNGRTSETLPQPLVVRGTRGGTPVAGLPVEWTISRGAATLSSAASVTDVNGRTSVNLTPGPLLGGIEITAAVATARGQAVRFTVRTTVVLIDILIDGFDVPLGGDSVEVVVGDTVEWVNRDALRHSVVSRSIPAGAPAFISGSLRNSERYRYVANVEGLYEYVDTLSVLPERPAGRISVVGRAVGALRVRTETVGAAAGASFVVTVDAERSSAIGPNDVVVFPALTPTAHLVRFVDPLESCLPAGDNPRSVTVVAGDTVTATFQVSCP